MCVTIDADHRHLIEEARLSDKVFGEVKCFPTYAADGGG
jgi:hypothetical protein